MKILASNFTDRLITGTVIKKCKIRSKGVGKRSEVWNFLYITRTVEARNFKHVDVIKL